MGDEKITIQQAMSILHRSEKQVRRHVKTGRLQGEIGQDGKYYLLKTEVEAMGRHPDRMQEDKVSRRMSSLETRMDEIEKRLDALSTHVDEIIEALYAMPDPHAAHPPPTPRSEPVKPSVAHPGAIPEELPEGTLHMQDFLVRYGLKGHRRRIIGYLDAPSNGLQFHSFPKPNRPTETDRYLEPGQQEELLKWLHVHHPEVFSSPGDD
jgi:hypothetical protein